MNQSILFSEKDVAYVDFHTHRARHNHRNDICEITSVHLGQSIPEGYFTIGMHPWWTEKIEQSDIDSLQTILTSDEHCLGLGEIGLDKLKGPDMHVQIKNLRVLFDIAIQVKKPVVIHCVRAYHQLLDLKKEYPAISNWCIHGYARHKVLAHQLLDQGFLISIMPVKHPNPAYIELIQNLPLDRFVLETDSMPKTEIEDIYLRVAEIKKIQKDALQRQILRNIKNFFSHE